MLVPSRSALAALVLAMVACSADAESVEDSSAATAREGQAVPVKLDGSDYLLRERTASVTVALSTPDSGARTIAFTREELAAGMTAKSHFLPSNTGTPTCSFDWQITHVEGRQLLAPAESLQPGGGAAFKGSCVVSSSGVTLRLPWEMATVRIERTPEALTNHGAILLMGKLFVDGTSGNFGFMANKPEQTQWQVDVLAAAGASRTAKLTWIRQGAPKTETEIVTAADVIRIE